MQAQPEAVADDVVQPFDPYQPLAPNAGKRPAVVQGTRANQRARRARILAVTRQLIGERGCDAVTVREISRRSGLALQTVYNLAGPRDRIFTDAITEYALYIGRVANRRGSTPTMVSVIDTWISAAEACPEFARQSNLIYFTAMRDVYYRFRDIQVRGVAKLLRHQQASGQIYLQSSARQVAEQLVAYAMAIWIEWADRPFPTPVLRQKLVQGVIKLMRE